MKNSVILYGKVISPVEFRSKSNSEDGTHSELYECSVEVQNKSMHGGVVRNLGKSTICLIYNKKVVGEGTDFDPKDKNMDRFWMNLKAGQCLKVEGCIVQDRVNHIGTSSVYVKSFELLDSFEDFQGNASTVITGKIFKSKPVLREFDNGTEKIAFLLNQTDGNVSMKTYIVAWNNLAHYIQDQNLDVNDEIEVVGNLVSRPYLDKKTNKELNVCELLAKRVTVLSRAEKVADESAEENIGR